jgi:hypothetical protein
MQLRWVKRLSEKGGSGLHVMLYLFDGTPGVPTVTLHAPSWIWPGVTGSVVKFVGPSMSLPDMGTTVRSCPRDEPGLAVGGKITLATRTTTRLREVMFAPLVVICNCLVDLLYSPVAASGLPGYEKVITGVLVSNVQPSGKCTRMEPPAGTLPAVINDSVAVVTLDGGVDAYDGGPVAASVRHINLPVKTPASIAGNATVFGPSIRPVPIGPALPATPVPIVALALATMCGGVSMRT